jgi:uncharacterized protein (DUF58 family)
MSLVTRRVRPGQSQGERRSTKRGTSVEFADYRDYSRGDDLRRIDWNIYARLERPFIKLFEEEEDLAVQVLLDASKSMGWGEDRNDTSEATNNKWNLARELAAALGYIALVSGDRLSVKTLSGPSTGSTFGPVRGRGHILRLLEWLEDQSTQGPTDLNGSLRSQEFQRIRTGLTVLISDLFSPTGFVEGLNSLAARGHDIVLLHTLSPDEIEPQLDGDLRLLDIETGNSQDVTVDETTRFMYTERMKDWQEEIGAACHARGIIHIQVRSDSPLERVVLTDLRRTRVLR